MPPSSPSRAGFVFVLRRPALLVAEVAWRWSFGLAFLGLLAAISMLYLGSIRISDSDLLLMKSGSPFLAADALAHALSGSKAALLRGIAVLVPGVAILWTIAAGFGRLVTVPPLFEAAADNVVEQRQKLLPASRKRFALRALLAISFFRAALALAGIAGYVGAAIIAGMLAQTADGLDLRVFFLVFIPLLLLDVFAWATINWFLSIAPLFVIRHGDGARDGFRRSVRLFGSNPRAFTAIGSGFGLARLIALIVVTGASIVVFGMLGELPAWFVVAAIVALTLVYFVFADLLYLSRLAAYAVLLQQWEDEQQAAREKQPSPQAAL